MSDARQVLAALYRRVHGREAEGEEAVLVWAAEQLALLLDGVEREADAAPAAQADTMVADRHAAQMAQLNADAQR